MALGLGSGLSFSTRCVPCGGSGMRGIYDQTQTNQSGFQFTDIFAGVTKHTDDEIKLVMEIKLTPPAKWDDDSDFDPVYTRFEHANNGANGYSSNTIHLKKQDGSAFGGTEGLREYTFTVPKADHDGSYGDTWRIFWGPGGDNPEAGAAFFIRNMSIYVTSDGGTLGDKFSKTWNFKKCKDDGTHNSSTDTDMVAITVAKDGIEPWSIDQGTLTLTKGWMLDDWTDGYN